MLPQHHRSRFDGTPVDSAVAPVPRGDNRRQRSYLKVPRSGLGMAQTHGLAVRLGIKDQRLTAVAKLLGLTGEVEDDHVLAAPADVGVLAKSALQQIITRSADQ